MTYNFNPGPAILPECVRTAAAAALAHPADGISVLEMSHRGKAFSAIHEDTLERCRSLFAVPEEFSILLLQGGASLQFAMIPENLLRPGHSADYIETGSWSTKAFEAAGAGGRSCRLAASSGDQGFSYIPVSDQLDVDPRAEYVHLTTNNTIYGTQFAALPDCGGVPVVADMSSDLLSRPVSWDADGIGVAYGGAQKNAGVAGLTVVILRRDLLSREREETPAVLRYSTHVEANSLYNTPPTFSIFVFGLVLTWLEDQGGLLQVAEHNRAKAQILYDAIDDSSGFYRGHAREDCRSAMNITFNLATPEDEKRFIAAAAEAGMVGLSGHRSIGGVRASVYNAMPAAGCRALAELMVEFARRHG